MPSLGRENRQQTLEQQLMSAQSPGEEALIRFTAWLEEEKQSVSVMAATLILAIAIHAGVPGDIVGRAMLAFPDTITIKINLKNAYLLWELPNLVDELKQQFGIGTDPDDTKQPDPPTFFIQPPPPPEIKA